MSWHHYGKRRYYYRHYRDADGRHRREYCGNGAQERWRKNASKPRETPTGVQSRRSKIELARVDGLAEELERGVKVLVEAVIALARLFQALSRLAAAASRAPRGRSRERPGEGATEAGDENGPLHRCRERWNGSAWASTICASSAGSWSEHREIWQEVGKLGHLAQVALDSRIAGSDLLVRESLYRYTQELKAPPGRSPGHRPGEGVGGARGCCHRWKFRPRTSSPPMPRCGHLGGEAPHPATEGRASAPPACDKGVVLHPPSDRGDRHRAARHGHGTSKVLPRPASHPARSMHGTATSMRRRTDAAGRLSRCS